MIRAVLPALVALVLTACAAGPARAPETPMPAEAPAEAPATPAPETPYVVPPRWTAAEAPGHVHLRAPDGDADVVLVEVDAPDRDAAVAEAWRRWKPGFDRPVLHAVDLPATDGWEASSQIVYVHPPEASWMTLAVARRLGATWHVALIDGPMAGVDRRGAQINEIVAGVRPAGLEAEDLGDRPARPLDAARLAELDAFVEHARTRLGVPGVALGVVQGGRVVLARGYGEREAGSGQPVTPETLFMIGSTTKSLTTLLMARLVDDGRLDWETPAREILPELRLGDPEASARLTVRDTVCACAGLPRQDMEMLFEYGDVTAEDRVAGLADMTPTTGFGETFQYSNAMVSAGGYLAARAARPDEALGEAYDRAMATRVFEPLGMTATTFDFDAVARADHAVPHGRRLPQWDYVPMPLSDEWMVRSVRPAGGAWSNVRDMSRYLQLELARGVGPDGTRFVSEENLLRRREPQVQAGADRAYGLGLFVEDVQGVPMVHHGGNTLGFTTMWLFLPEHDVGLVLLSNAAAANSLWSAVRRRLLEVLFDAEARAGADLEARVARDAQLLDQTYTTLTLESAWARDWTGPYENAALGRLELSLRDGRAVLDAGEWRAPVGHRLDADGTARLVLVGPPLTALEFELGEREGRRALTLRTGQQVYVFRASKAR